MVESRASVAPPVEAPIVAPRMIHITTGDYYKPDMHTQPHEFKGKLVIPQTYSPSRAAVLILKDPTDTADTFQQNLAISGTASLSYVSSPVRKLTEKANAISYKYTIDDAIASLFALMQETDAQHILIAAQGAYADTAARMLERLHSLSSERQDQRVRELAREAIQLQWDKDFLYNVY